MSTPLTSEGMAQAFIYQKLASDTQIQAILFGNPAKVFAGLAPEGTAAPYITFDSLGGVDTQPLGMIRTLSRPQYIIKAITNVSSILAMDALMARVDALLQGASASFSPGAVLACTRQRTMVLADPDMGVSYRQLCATYEIVTSESPTG